MNEAAEDPVIGRVILSGDHEQDCQVVLTHVHAFLDHELDAESMEVVRFHLSTCSSCVDVADAEQLLKDLVRRHCGQAVAPSGLRAKISSRLDILVRQNIQQ